MQYNNLFNLIKSALPEDADYDAMYRLQPEEMWQFDPDSAATFVLQNSSAFDWNAYLENNPDVKNSGMDPAEHYSKYGVYEGRKLYTHNSLKDNYDANCPAVSIIIAVYNNGIFLRKCIESTLTQTLRNIEIIAVDDCSTDNSMETLSSFAATDPRIKVLENDINSGIFLTRKKGVLAARGKYIKFMDGDDYLTPDSCETGFNEICKGYDIVEAGTNIINIANIDNDIIDASHRYFNTDQRKEYVKNEILKAYYEDNTLSWCLWNKIFLREICVAAFRELEDGFYVGTEDAYAFAAIGRRARKLLKIEKPLYCYHYGSGVTTIADEGKKNALWFKNGEALLALEKYIDSHSLPVNFKMVKRNQCAHSFRRWLAFVSDNEAVHYFDILRQQYGMGLLLEIVLERFADQIVPIARKFKHCVDGLPDATASISRVGVLFTPPYTIISRLYLQELAIVCSEANLCISIYTSRESIHYLKHDLKHIDNINIIQIDFCDGKNQLADLENTLDNQMVDLMIHLGAVKRDTLCAIMLLYDKRVPLLVSYDGNFASPFYGLKKEYLPYHEMQAILEAASAVICFSTSTELLLRMNGVNATALAYHLYFSNELSGSRTSGYSIVIFADPEDANAQIEESLKIIQEVKRYYPRIAIYIVGNYINDTDKAELIKKATPYHLEASIEIICEIEELLAYLAKSGVLLSTAFNDSVNLPASLATTIGLPAVVYNTQQTGNNIISIAPGNVQAAVDAIVKILNDTQKNAPVVNQPLPLARKGHDAFQKEFMALLCSFQNNSALHKYGGDDYARIIRAAAEFSCRKL